MTPLNPDGSRDNTSISADSRPSFADACQAHRTHRAECTVAKSSGAEAYWLCKAAREHLQNGTLRPLDVFYLSALHGLQPGGYLGPHRYTPTGQPARKFPPSMLEWFSPRAPDLQSCLHDPGLTLDFAAFQFAFDCIVANATEIVPGAGFAALLHEMQARIAAGVPRHAEYVYYEVVARHGDPSAADWLRSRWQHVHSYVDSSLASASVRCMSRAEVAELCLAAIAKYPPTERDGSWLMIRPVIDGWDDDHAFGFCLAVLRLLLLRDRAQTGCILLPRFAAHAKYRESILNWIEATAFSHDAVDPSAIAPHPDRSIITTPRFEHWGALASVCHISWPRLKAWLRRGRPLSHVAIDTLVSCGAFEPSRMMPTIAALPRPLCEPDAIDQMTRVLQEFAGTDGDARIRRAVGMIVADWPRITQTAR